MFLYLTEHPVHVSSLDRLTLSVCMYLREVHPSYSCLPHTGSSLLSSGCVCVCGRGSRVERSVEVWPQPCVKLLTYATVAGVRDTWWMLFALDWGVLNHSQMLCCFGWRNEGWRHERSRNKPFNEVRNRERIKEKRRGQWISTFLIQ